MLILNRKVGESIIIAEDIEVIVTSINGDSIKLGIKAPGDIGIYRKEVYEEITLENQSAKDSFKQFQKIMENK